MIVSGPILSSDTLVIDYFHNPTVPSRLIAITFTSSANRALEGLGFGGKFLLDNKIDVIAVKCSSDDWYQSIPDESFELIERIVRHKEYSKVVSYGASMGGYAAILFSERLKCDVVLALSPQYSIVESFDKRWESHARKILWRHKVSREAIRQSCQYVIIYDEHDLDKGHAERFSSLIPEANYVGIGLPFGGHPISNYLLEVGVIKNVALRVFLGDRVDCRNLMENRRASKSFLKNLSIYLYKKNKSALSLLMIDRAIKLDGGVSSFFTHKSLVLEGMGRLNDSISSLISAINLDANPLLKLRVSKLLMEGGRYEEALRYIDSGLTEFGDMAVLHRKKSEILLAQSELILAVSSATIACDIEPRNPYYRIHLSGVYVRQGRYDAALLEVDRALIFTPRIAALYRTKIEILRRLGDAEAAEVVLRSQEYVELLD